MATDSTKRASNGKTATRGAASKATTPAKRATAKTKQLNFPSVEWFEALAGLAKQDERYRKFGRLNAVVVFKVGGKMVEMTFDVLDIHTIREVDENAMRGADFVVELSPEHWEQMLANIKEHGHATQDWTLNTLDLRFDDPIHKNLLDDGFKADMFFRYNPSLQRFFDKAAELEYSFDKAAVSA